MPVLFFLKNLEKGKWNSGESRGKGKERDRARERKGRAK